MKNWEGDDNEANQEESDEMEEFIVYWSDGSATKVDAKKLFVYSPHDSQSMMAAKKFVRKAKQDEEFFVMNLANVNGIAPVDVEVKGKELLNE